MAKKTATERDFSKAFGQVLKRIRTKRGLSQEEFGNLLGLHRTHMGFIERGERTPLLDTVFDISVVLGISMPGLMEQTFQEYEVHYKHAHRPKESGPKKTS
jgi:transcriptional regulator with XRE-family HTH domain